jgi:hypothetical protein
MSMRSRSAKVEKPWIHKGLRVRALHPITSSHHQASYEEAVVLMAYRYTTMVDFKPDPDGHPASGDPWVVANENVHRL